MKYFFILIVIFSISLVSAEVSYEVSFEDDEIINGRDFYVDVELIDGEDDTLYDGKLWIESKGKIISDRYDTKKESWRSGYYYINGFFVDGKNKINLRIDEEYSKFDGRAFIYFKLRGEEQIGDEIEVLDFKEEEKDTGISKEESSKNTDNPIEDKREVSPIVENVVLEELQPISLGSKVSTVEEKDINSDNVVYQSKGLKIIEYSVYGFAVLCVLLCVLVMWRKLD